LAPVERVRHVRRAVAGAGPRPRVGGETSTEVRPVALTVNVAAPLLALSAVIVTLCRPNAKLAGRETSASCRRSPTGRCSLRSRATDTVTFADGAEDSDTPNRPGAALGDVLRGGSHQQAGACRWWTRTSVAVMTAGGCSRRRWR